MTNAIFKMAILKRVFKNLIKKHFFKGLEIGYSNLQILKKIAGKGNTVIEIGSFRGGTTRILAKKNKVIAIDPYTKFDDGGDSCKEDPELVYSDFIKNTKGLNVEQIRKTSQQAFKEWDGRIVDGIFIDGCHTYEMVKQDFRWVKYLKKNGWIAFHDVSPYFKGVENFVKSEVLIKYELIKIDGILWIFKNKKIKDFTIK